MKAQLFDGHPREPVASPFLARVTAVVLLLALLLPVPARAMPRNVKLGDPIGTLKLTDIDGKPLDTAAWSGSPTAWVFVSATQASSEKALLGMQAALDALVGSNVRAVAITTDALHVTYFREMRSRSGLRLPVVVDPTREVYGRIGVIVLPTTLILDKTGKLVHVVSGYDLDYSNVVQAHLAHLAGRINADELQRRLATSRPAGDAAHDRAARLCRSAEVMCQRGLAQEAAKELESAIKAAPDYAPAYLRLARLKVVAGDLPAAAKLVAEVQKRNPENHSARLVLGIIQFHEGKLDEAEQSLKQALQLNPDPARTRYWLGRVAEAKKQPEQAAAHFRAAAEALGPDLSDEPTTRPGAAAAKP